MRKRSLLILAPAALGLVMAGLVSTKAADSKEIITFQCRLVNNGTPVNGTLDLTFRIYDATSGGHLLHEEEIQNVVVTNGLLSVQLGTNETGFIKKVWADDVTPDPPVRDRFVDVLSGGTSLLGSMIQITAVPFSMNSGVAEIASTIWDPGDGSENSGTALSLAGLDSRYVRTEGSTSGQTIIGGTNDYADLILRATPDDGTLAGQIVLKHDVEIETNLDIAGTLTVDGSSTLTGDVDAQGDLAVGDNLTVGKVIELAHTATPTGITTDHVALYAKNDGRLYYKPDDGDETEVGSGAGGGSASNCYTTNGFRLTVEDGEAIPTSDVTDATEVYLTPHKSNEVWTKDSALWTRHASGQISVPLSSTVVIADHNFDVFVSYDEGADPPLILEVKNTWADDTSRNSGAIVRDDASGILVWGSDSSRRYVGTIRSTTAGKVDDSKQRRFVWNVDNQVRRTCSNAAWFSSSVLTGSGSWFEVSSAARVHYVTGAAGRCIRVKGSWTSGNASTGTTPGVGIGLDSSTYTGYAVQASPTSVSGSAGITSFADHSIWPSLGAHYLTVLGSISSGNSYQKYAAAIHLDFWG